MFFFFVFKNRDFASSHNDWGTTFFRSFLATFFWTSNTFLRLHSTPSRKKPGALFRYASEKCLRFKKKVVKNDRKKVVSWMLGMSLQIMYHWRTFNFRFTNAMTDTNLLKLESLTILTQNIEIRWYFTALQVYFPFKLLYKKRGWIISPRFQMTILPKRLLVFRIFDQLPEWWCDPYSSYPDHQVPLEYRKALEGNEKAFCYLSQSWFSFGFYFRISPTNQAFPKTESKFM